MILVDSNMWLFAHMNDYPEHKTAKPMIERLLKSDVVAINAIVISEFYHKLSLMLSREIASEKVGAILASEHVIYLPIQKETSAKAVSMAARLQMRINDAIIGQQALDERATVLTDDGRAFKKIKALKLMPFVRNKDMD